MNKTTCFLIIFVISWQTLSAKRIKDTLQSKFLEYSVMKAALEKANKQQTGETPYFLELFNLEKLAQTIQSGVKAVGRGQFGKVFKYQMRASIGSDLTIPVAAKEIFINNNYNSAQGREEQDMLEDEITFNEGLKTLDPNELYFPSYIGTYDVTNFFPKFVDGSTDEEIKQYLVPKKTQELLVLEMEFLDQEIFKYSIEMVKGLVKPYLHTRLKIGENIVKGLLAMIEKYFHCDIKPENVMARVISKEEQDRLATFGVERVELYPGKFYQIKLIDFGLVASGARSDRECEGGTPGFIPPEFFNGSSHENFDVFSIAMLMLDNELASDRMGFYSDTHAEVVNCMRKNDGFDQKQKIELMKNSFYKMANHFSTNATYKDELYKQIRLHFPKFNSMISKNFSGEEPEEVKMTKYIFGNPMLFQGIMKATLDVYVSMYYPNHTVPKVIQEHELAATKAASDLSKIGDKSSEAYRVAFEKAQYLKYKQEIFENKPEIDKLVRTYLVSQIYATASERDSMEKFLANIVTFRKEFEGTLSEQLKYVLKYERHNPTARPNSTSMESYEAIEIQKRASFRLDDNFLVLI